MHRKAIIDLGSNTFHLLIMESVDGLNWSAIYRERSYVFLSEKGTKHIYPESWERGMNCLKAFNKIIAQHNTAEVIALGTAALRNADNAQQFVLQVKEDFNIPIQIISGREEAQLISKGVMNAMKGLLSEFLIMDIGGGSVEFILVEDHNAIWEQSFPIGLSELKRLPFFTDPLDADTLLLYKEHLASVLNDLTELLKDVDGIPLVGASGTFDATLAMLRHKDFGTYAQSSVDSFQSLFNNVKYLSLKERLEHPLIPNKRAPLFNVALLLVDFVITHYPIDGLYVSHFGMKEGVL